MDLFINLSSTYFRSNTDRWRLCVTDNNKIEQQTTPKKRSELNVTTKN